MTALVLSALLVATPALAACGGDDSSPTTSDPRLIGPPETAPTPDPAVDLGELSTPYGCGFGFQAGNTDQTIGFFLESGGGFGQPPSTDLVELAGSRDWKARIDFGTDLFANWCDDVIEPDEPTPAVSETWTVSEGTLEFVVAETEGNATVRVTGVVAVDEDGVEHELGDITIVNPAWGMFAG